MIAPRRAALGGLVGVGGFVAAWAIVGATRAGSSPVDDAISRLAEVGAPGRNWMTAGFVVFGVGIPIYAQALRRTVDGPAWIAATATGLATLGVAAAPLGRALAALVLATSTIDAGHGLSQRLGLGIVDAWIVATAWTIRRHGRLPAS